MINYVDKSFDEMVDWVRGGEPSKDMNFGQAIECLKRGAKITRASFKEFNAWIALAPDGKLHTYEKDDETGTVRDFGYVDLQGEDIFAEDWEVVQ